MPLDGIIGVHGNLWDGEQTGVDGFSKIVDTKSYPNISIILEIVSESDVEFYVSANGEDFTICGQLTEKLPGGQTGNLDVHLYEVIGARYIRLRSSDDVIATGTISAKR